MAESAKPLVVVMGVSGSGKSTVGALLVDELLVPFVDADDLHPITNIDKMAAGLPLSDDDRWPWLERVGQTLAGSASGLVVACSALKFAYREAIRRRAPATWFVLLDGSQETLADRLGQREKHFMPPELLDSQREALEPLGAGELGVSFDIGQSPERIAAEAAALISHSA